MIRGDEPAKAVSEATHALPQSNTRYEIAWSARLPLQHTCKPTEQCR